MQLEVGKIYDGKVKNLAKFGAFVEIKDTSITGMVHISEIANTFVKEVSDLLTENQEVKVKVLSITDTGKISLSIKKALSEEQEQPAKKFYNNNNNNSNNNYNRSNNNNYNRGNSNNNTGGNGGYSNNYHSNFSGASPAKEPAGFEDMLSSFKKRSEEKMGDIKRNLESKRKSTSRK